MKVLFLDAYFIPEQIAFTHLENDLLEGLVEAGHEIEIICPTPTRGVDTVTAKNTKRSEYLFDRRVHVTRFWAPHEGKNIISRALRYFWCNIRTYQIGIKYNIVDAVFANSTPPTQGWIAGKVAKKLKVPFIYSLQDIFPDSLVNAGMTKEGSVIWRIGRKIEDKTYSYANKIIVISPKCRENILSKNVPTSKIHLICNWIDINFVTHIDRSRNSLFSELDIQPSKFIVVYAGNMGEMQDAVVILGAAEKLRKYQEIRFVLFGSGSNYNSIREQAKSLSNVSVFPLMPLNRISEVYSLGDVALITCKKGTGNAGFPSKLWSIMACETPIIASFDMDSDLAEVLRDSCAGECVEPGNVNSLAESILRFTNSAYRMKYTSGSMRQYVLNHGEKNSCISEYKKIITDGYK